MNLSQQALWRDLAVGPLLPNALFMLVLGQILARHHLRFAHVLSNKHTFAGVQETISAIRHALAEASITVVNRERP